MKHEEEWEQGKGIMPKRSRSPTTLFPSLSQPLPSVLDVTRTLPSSLASAANYSKSPFPPLKLKTDVVIHQADLEGYYIEGSSGSHLFKSSKVFSGRLL